MYLTNETARAHQQTMLARAAEQRQALRVRALGRATRRADRAQRQLAHALRDEVRLRAELAAGRKS
jgi:hypothetical protein